MFTCTGPPHLVTSRYVRRHLVRPGDRLRLPCPVRANPPALVTWYKDGGTIHLGWDRYRVRADDWTLSVRDVQLDDTGIFTCRATNGFGSIDITYLVYVSRKSLRRSKWSSGRVMDRSQTCNKTYDKLIT